MRVNKLGNSAVVAPIDVHPRHGGWNINCSKTGKTDASIGVNEDVFLDEREWPKCRERNVRTISRLP